MFVGDGGSSDTDIGIRPATCSDDLSVWCLEGPVDLRNGLDCGTWIVLGSLYIVAGTRLSND
jgi:hypothetical protein